MHAGTNAWVLCLGWFLARAPADSVHSETTLRDSNKTTKGTLAHASQTQSTLLFANNQKMNRTKVRLWRESGGKYRLMVKVDGRRCNFQILHPPLYIFRNCAFDWWQHYSFLPFHPNRQTMASHGHRLNSNVLNALMDGLNADHSVVPIVPVAPEDMGTLTRTLTLQTGTDLGVGKTITEEQYQSALTVVKTFEKEAANELKLTIVHRSMMRTFVHREFFSRCKFLPTKGDLLQKMKDEMMFVFQNIEIIHPDDIKKFSKDMQRCLRYMLCQKRSYYVNQIFSLYKGNMLAAYNVFVYFNFIISCGIFFFQRIGKSFRLVPCCMSSRNQMCTMLMNDFMMHGCSLRVKCCHALSQVGLIISRQCDMVR
jgi:hypothetical protein